MLRSMCSFLFFLLINLCVLAVSRSFFNFEILFRIFRRLISSFCSPGPLVPIPPPSLDRYIPSPVNLGKRYRSCASSTSIFPSFDFARFAKISRISCVLSKVLTLSILSRFLCWLPVKSLLNKITSACFFSDMKRSSSALPLPTYSAGSIKSLFIIFSSTTSRLQDRASCLNSSALS